MDITKATIVFIVLMVVGYFGVFVFFIKDAAPPSTTTTTRDNTLCTLEHNMLSAIINAESGPNPADARDPYLVGSTVLNRSEHESFPDVVCDVIREQGQYNGYRSNNYYRTDASDTVAFRLLNGNGRNCSVLFFVKTEDKAGFEYIRKKYDLITLTNSHTFYGE